MNKLGDKEIIVMKMKVMETWRGIVSFSSVMNLLSSSCSSYDGSWSLSVTVTRHLLQWILQL